ncbi:PilN domain-containing protein [Candidatus Nitrosacidococcus tergens]|uniref:Fimbrial assembly family protein n=1 Tax=Candidatus Nitrosacidococcus tergens TaxID=553981 RepID=A0A7G1Q7F6_9GAMM|nr:PilN domain-containing protein [Candidatus Nitrosacidococcus tergens]CAB1274323.1 Fimbrial assembly family protein [Candidatus Nitrosacidococcus tergens]
MSFKLKWSNQAGQNSFRGFLTSSPGLNRFFAWWWEGLKHCIPQSLQKSLWREKIKIILLPQGEGLRIIRNQKGQKEELGFYDGIQHWDKALLGDSYQLIFRLFSTQTLTKSIELPLAAEENLRQVLAFEMERHTPFNANQVYYDYTIINRHTSREKKIVVGLALVPREILTQWLTKLEKWDLQPERVDVIGTQYEGKVNLLPLEFRSSKTLTLQSKTIFALGGLSFLLIVAALLLPLWQERSVVIKLMAETAAAHLQANRIITIRDQADEAVENSEFLATQKEQAPIIIDLLYELTHLFPDSIWIHQFTINKDQIDIQGEAQEASALITLLENTPYFEQVQFRSPVTTNQVTNRDRFHITARLLLPKATS